MHWLADLLIAALDWFAPRQREDRSIVGKSRDEEASERFWVGCGVVLFIALMAALFCWARTP